ncbi:glutathione S-transferase [Auriculariales sp. MPI-PUGE-AT-0066]|nr:glutathione S-transferase [Auriculariales sp. MPI-PUGE-AT-0066]
MAPILYGAPFSTCTQRIMLAFQEIGLEFDVLKAPEWLEKQPFAMVPYIVDGDFLLYESRAITKYAVSKYGNGSTLVPSPSDLEATARFDAACSIEQANFDKFVGEILWEKVYKLWSGGATDEARVKELFDKLEQRMDGYERILSRQNYLAGDIVTLADLSHVPYAWMLETSLKSDIFAKRPNVSRWWDDLKTRPQWKAVVAKTTAA